MLQLQGLVFHWLLTPKTTAASTPPSIQRIRGNADSARAIELDGLRCCLLTRLHSAMSGVKHFQLKVLSSYRLQN